MKNANLNLELKLSNALFLLLKTKSYSKITINDLTKQVKISRTTFYLCFEDKNDLLHYSCERYFVPFLASIKDGFTIEKENFIKNTTSGLNQIKPQLPIFKSILDLKDIDFNPSEVILSSTQKKIKDVLDKQFRQANQLEKDYYAHIFSVCLLETQQWWSEHVDEMSANDIAQFIYKACFSGINKIISN